MGLLELLYEAVGADGYGIQVRTEDAERLRQKLYPLKNSNPVFADLVFILSPFDPATRLWIMKKGSRDGDQK